MDEPKELNQNLQECQQKSQEYLDGWRRTQADFVNYKKDETKRVRELIQFSNEGIILELVEAVDNLETALAHAPPEIQEKQEWFKGLEDTLKLFQALLKKYGVERIATIGEKFDPLIHESVQMGPTEQETVTEEYRTGYKLFDKIIRPARVKVGK